MVAARKWISCACGSRKKRRQPPKPRPATSSDPRSTSTTRQQRSCCSLSIRFSFNNIIYKALKTFSSEFFRQLLELIDEGKDPALTIPKPEPSKPKGSKEPKEKPAHAKVKALLAKAQDKLLESKGWKNLLQEAKTFLDALLIK